MFAAPKNGFPVEVLKKRNVIIGIGNKRRLAVYFAIEGYIEYRIYICI